MEDINGMTLNLLLLEPLTDFPGRADQLVVAVLHHLGAGVVWFATHTVDLGSRLTATAHLELHLVGTNNHLL